MKKLLPLLILSIILLYACSAQKRLNRLERKHPELFRIDTIWKYDTVKIEGIKFDTIIKSGITTDTVTLVKDNVIIKYFNDGKTVYLQGETKTIEKIIKVPVQIKSAVITKEVNWIPLWVYISFIGAGILIFILALRK